MNGSSILSEYPTAERKHESFYLFIYFNILLERSQCKIFKAKEEPSCWLNFRYQTFSKSIRKSEFLQYQISFHYQIWTNMALENIIQQPPFSWSQLHVGPKHVVISELQLWNVSSAVILESQSTRSVPNFIMYVNCWSVSWWKAVFKTSHLKIRFIYSHTYKYK